jgi:hypothetical protein
MSNQGEGLKAADLIQIWIGLAASLTALFMWLTYRLQRGGFLLSVPHLAVAESRYSNGVLLRFALSGPGADQWKITEIALISPRSIEMFSWTSAYDPQKGEAWINTGDALGRKIAKSESGVVVPHSDVPIKFRVKLALKAWPSVTSRRTTTINTKD